VTCRCRCVVYGTDTDVGHVTLLHDPPDLHARLEAAKREQAEEPREKGRLCLAQVRRADRAERDLAAARRALEEARDCLANLMLVIVQMEADPSSLRSGCRDAIAILERHKGIGVRMNRVLAAETGAGEGKKR